ncbi:restriction endonuclease subunit S [Marinimicrobium sp. C2-29]|uniref:restriction endonuclease subunit S n=1 Tax=Marinimicrobium sp. C2-29 TaxID=3139825 RepID=UPI00313A2BD7
MGHKWVEKKIEDIAAPIENAMSTGPFGSAISSKYFKSHGVPVIRGSNLSTDVGERMSDDGLVFVDLEKAVEFRRSVVRTNDLVFTCWGTINQIGLISNNLRYPEYIISNKQMKLTPDPEKVDPLFLYYLFSSPLKQAEIIQNGIGAAVPGFNLGQLKKQTVRLPPLTEQKKISAFLDSFDARIRLNKQANKTLESMAQTLFKSWFLNFDPVIDNALAEGKEIPDPLAANAATRQALREQGTDKPGQLHALPEHIRQLFPNRFQFTEELGWIPEGWEINTLRSVTTELRRGISPKYVEEGGVRVINQKCIRDHVINMTPARRHDTSKKKVDGRLISIGDVLVNSTGVGTLGRIAQVYSLDEPTVVDSHVTVVRPNTEVFKPYFFGRLMLSIERSVEALGMGSTGQTELSRADLGAHPVVTPPLEIQNWVEELLKRCADRISFNAKQSETLIASRDTLLPKLLSGELRIPEAEKMLDEALA